MKTKLCLAAMVAALLIVVGPVGSASADCPQGTTDPTYCTTGAPIVDTTAATAVTATSATLNGTVNPNGLQTTYRFEYGPTVSYGTQTTVTTITVSSPQVLADYQAKNVSVAVAGLTPNTLYNVRVTATNSAGTTNGDNVTFTTTAAAPYGLPPAVTTGAATNITQTSATLTGTINPRGSAALVAFQLGLTTSYGIATPAQQAGSGNAAIPAAANVSGLAPGTLYHFRIVGSGAAGLAFGNDATFTTRAYTTPPPVRRRPRLSLRVKPKRDATKPYRYRARGTLRRPSGVGRAAGCRGRVRITVKRGNKLVSRKTTRIKRSTCKYATRVNAKRRLGKKVRGTLRVRARFLGNSRLLPRNSKTVKVKFGPKRA